MVEGHCLQAMKIVDHYVNDCFDWLISGKQSVNPLRETISILSGRYKRFTFVPPVVRCIITACKVSKMILLAKAQFIRRTAAVPNLL